MTYNQYIIDVLNNSIKQTEAGRKVLSLGFRSSFTTEVSKDTNLDCRCGAKLTETRSVINPYKYALFINGPEPRVKTRAKRKIALKKFREKFKRTMLGACLAAPLRNRPSYVCNSCGRIMGFYEAIGTNIIKVEPMAPGANIFYHDQS
jgi:hypothetical protein